MLETEENFVLAFSDNPPSPTLPSPSAIVSKCKQSGKGNVQRCGLNGYEQGKREQCREKVEKKEKKI
jgi:hypothetical protein